MFSKKETQMEIGQKVIDYIIRANLVFVENELIIWSANAAEQVGAFIEKHNEVYDQ